MLRNPGAVHGPQPLARVEQVLFKRLQCGRCHLGCVLRLSRAAAHAVTPKRSTVINDLCRRVLSFNTLPVATIISLTETRA